MPDQNGRLTDEDRQKIQTWWVGRWKAPVLCPVCKTGSWSLGSHVVNIERHAGNAGEMGSAAYPMVMVNCQTCSHTMFFNAVMIGVATPYDSAADQTLLPPKSG